MKNPARKIVCVALLVASGLLLVPGAAGAQVQLRHAGLVQKGRELVLSVQTSEPVGLGKLEPHPDPRRAASRYLCFEFSSRASSSPLRYCLGGRKAHRRLGLEQVDSTGPPDQQSWVRATV